MDPQRILVIRRDNIGDLLCTTPLIAALRLRFPRAHLAALTNSYNLAVLARNPDVNAVHTYTKLKHRPAGTSVFRWLCGDRLQLLGNLGRAKFDLVILAAPAFQSAAVRFARATRAAHVLGVTSNGKPGRGIDLVPLIPSSARHEVERVFSLLSVLGVAGDPPPLKLIADDAALRSAHQRIAEPGATRVIGIHISARKPSQRWGAERFVELMRSIQRTEACAFALFWAPGATGNPLHPGDDDKAQQIIDSLGTFPLRPFRTDTLEQLIAGIAVCNNVICSDGGAMHIAAALGKPLVCLFGDSDAARWHPWGVRYELLQPASRDVADISVEDVHAAWRRLND